MDKIKDEIESFIGIFEENLNAIKSVNFAVRDNLFKKVLCVGIIDALSKAVYPSKGNSRERFTSFIKYFCDWQHGKKISLPHLIQLFKNVPEPEFSDLRKYSLSCIQGWDQNSEIKLDSDVDLDVVSQKWPKGYDKTVGKIRIEFLTHYKLLYEYRNSIIHEMRRLPGGIEHRDDKEPYYLFVEDHWELCYPLNFFYRLCEIGLVKLKVYLEDNQINPYDYFVFGEYWIEDLNI